MKEERGTLLQAMLCQKWQECLARISCEEDASEINAKTEWGETPLHIAARFGHHLACSAILARPDFHAVNAKTIRGSLLQELAVDHKPYLRAILGPGTFKAESAKSIGGLTALHIAAQQGSVQICRGIIGHAKFNSINVRTDKGETPYKMATRLGKLQAAEEIAKHGGY